MAFYFYPWHALVASLVGFFCLLIGLRFVFEFGILQQKKPGQKSYPSLHFTHLLFACRAIKMALTLFHWSNVVAVFLTHLPYGDTVSNTQNVPACVDVFFDDRWVKPSIYLNFRTFLRNLFFFGSMLSVLLTRGLLACDIDVNTTLHTICNLVRVIDTCLSTILWVTKANFWYRDIIVFKFWRIVRNVEVQNRSFWIFLESFGWGSNTFESSWWFCFLGFDFRSIHHSFFFFWFFLTKCNIVKDDCISTRYTSWRFLRSNLLCLDTNNSTQCGP